MKTRKPRPMSEGRATIMLARHFGYDIGDYFCFPQIQICSWVADLAVISGARLLTEVEIKLTIADFRKDAVKKKWPEVERLVSRFFYAVPERLVPEVQPLLRPGQGLISILDNGRTQEIVAARRRRTTKITDEQLQRFLKSTYFRFWRERGHRHQQIERQKHEKKNSAT